MMIRVVVIDDLERKMSPSAEAQIADIVIAKKVTYEIVKNRRGPTGELKSLEDLTAYL